MALSALLIKHIKTSLSFFQQEKALTTASDTDVYLPFPQEYAEWLEAESQATSEFSVAECTSAY